jgi:hypothetical protein
LLQISYNLLLKPKEMKIEKTQVAIPDAAVINKIYHIRGKKVMLDRDLAEMYGVETRVLNQAVKRNEKRFPIDFMFQLTEQELEEWKSQIVTSNKEKMGLRKLPNVFTEQGVAMLSSVLNSETAIEVNIQIIRIFTRIREALLSNKDILLKMEQLEKTMLKQNEKTNKHEQEIEVIFKALKQLLELPNPPRKRIGFKTD